VISVKNRKRLIGVARFLERRAAQIRKYVAANTPKRGDKVKENQIDMFNS